MYTDAQSFQIKTVEIYLHCNRDVRYDDEDDDDDDNIERLACVGICDVCVCGGTSPISFVQIPYYSKES